MALPADFSKIFGSTATGGLTPIGDVNYAKGWEFVGSTPPTKNDFSYLQNLSDLKSQWLYNNKLQRKDPFGDIKSDGAAAIAAALSNLGLGEAAKLDVGMAAGTVASGDDSRITGALQKANNLYELTNKSDARANLGLGTVATKNVGNSAGQIPDMSYWSSPAGGINFPNGFQMRFGTIAGTGGKLFSTPFTNQCYGIVFGQTYGANYWMFSPMYRASDLSNTGFAFINKAWSGVPGVGSQDAGESVFYIAVGY